MVHAKMAVNRILVRLWSNLDQDGKILSNVMASDIMVVFKVGSQKLATKFGFVPDWWRTNKSWVHAFHGEDLVFLQERRQIPGVGVTWPVSSISLFLFKYECDSKNLTGTYARSKILLTEKLTEHRFSNPHPRATSMLRNDKKCKYIFMFPKINSSQGLTHWGLVMPFGDINLAQHWLR